MKKVVPKLLYDAVSHSNLPVWEITQSNGNKLYYERKHYKMLIPIGIINSINISNTRCDVFDVVKLNKGEKINVIKESKEFPIPSNWYGTNLKYCINNAPKNNLKSLNKNKNKNKRKEVNDLNELNE
jgi:hypothetical protein